MTPSVRRIVATVGHLYLAHLVAAPLGAQDTDWRDPSAHEIRFVTVEEGVRLELLDWGGAGRPVILLAGSGNTAHSFDDFAPTLLDCCHVYGITRRGYGESSRPADGYGWKRLAEDVFRVIEQEHIAAPVLIGHSMSGGEMTAVGHEHSDRLAGIVYLDALGDLEDDPSADTEWIEAQQRLPANLLPPPRACDPDDRSSFAAYRQTWGCSLGFMFPESEVRAIYTEQTDGSVGPPKSPGWVSHAIGQWQIFRRDYSGIHVPVLALSNTFAPTATTDDLLEVTAYAPKNAEERAAIDRFMARSAVLIGRWQEKITHHVSRARFVYYPLAGHFVHMTREADVLREIHSFVASLDR